jgi:hypothetical protein
MNTLSSHPSTGKRTCSECGEEKKPSCFYKHNNPNICKKCIRTLNKSVEVPKGKVFCTVCRELKGADEKFHSRSIDGTHGLCYQCFRELENEVYSTDPHKAHSAAVRSRKNLYGMTHEYDLLFAQQKGLCAVCGNPELRTFKGKPMRLSVDHDHVTGRIRALLCSECNTAFGLLHEDPERIIKLLHYCETLHTGKPLILATG